LIILLDELIIVNGFANDFTYDFIIINNIATFNYFTYCVVSLLEASNVLLQVENLICHVVMLSCVEKNVR
jgi:hypothetical protein